MSQSNLYTACSLPIDEGYGLSLPNLQSCSHETSCEGNLKLSCEGNLKFDEILEF